MQDDLKTTIRFDDYYAVYGSQGVVAMAWWLGTQLAERIRTEQFSFPFLYITGGPGSGKTSLLHYLWKLRGVDSPSCCAVGQATPTGITRFISDAGDLPVVLDASFPCKPETRFDWNELASLYCSDVVLTHAERDNSVFKGSLVISANPPIECSNAIESRMARIFLSTPQSSEHQYQARRLHELPAEQAAVFGRLVERRADELLSTVNKLAPAYSATLMEQHPEQLTPRTAKNGGQLMALVDALSLTLNLTAEQRHRALGHVPDIVCPDFIAY